MYIGTRLISQTACAVMALLFLTTLPAATDAYAATQGNVTIKRDDFGVPHIYAGTTYGIFYGFGYALAEDQLFQMDMLRRTASGSVAEVLGAKYLDHDRLTRSSYAAASLQRQYESLPPEDRAIFDGYAAGYNARLKEVLAARAELLPREFTEFGFDPVEWTPLDVLKAYVHSMALRFSDANAEIENLALLTKLQKRHGAVKGQALFDQLRWKRDPHAPTTVPADQNAVEHPAAAALSSTSLIALSDAAIAEQLRLQKLRYGGTGPDSFPRASNIWVVSSNKTAGRESMLVNGPQMGDFSPSYIWAVGLHGAGFDLVGSGPMASPWLIFGTNGKIGWGSTAGMGDTVDIYQEKLDPRNPHRYFFNGQYHDMEKRTETIRVKDGKPVMLDVYSTVHGPVVQFDKDKKTAFARKRTWDGSEVQSLVAWIHSMKATDFATWRADISKVTLTINNYYVDASGNIGYAFLGKFPVRPAGQDIRLPVSGTGEMEWQGFRSFDSNPSTYNPSQGFIANWNNKPQPDYDSSDYMYWSAVDHLNEVNDELNKQKTLTVGEVWNVVAKVSFTDDNARYFLPLIAAAAANWPESSNARHAAEILAHWDRNTIDPKAKGKSSAGYILFRNFLPLLAERVIGPLVPKNLSGGVDDETQLSAISPFFPTMGTKITYNALMGSASGVPQTVDFLAGRSRDIVLREALEEAMTKLSAKFGSDTAAWTEDAEPHVFHTENYAKIPQTVARNELSLPAHMNRGTTNNRIIFRDGRVDYCDVTPPGQSGFMQPDGKLSVHARDQLDLYQNFGCKPQWLNADDVEKHTVSHKKLTY
ncbi:penicillin acylase family protein [Govanella unica]|uniref:Penicillin acylase family protein n=1 Tax=Govanella unica TaxID=2975056 RepID=A0A9X3TZ41_9PROT|nr:penicillin acylase family protein [Govania unica]MDA5194429.1 penicillin acylase family protein [Govania unica]